MPHFDHTESGGQNCSEVMAFIYYEDIGVEAGGYLVHEKSPRACIKFLMTVL